MLTETIQSKGGKARAETLTKEELSESAKKAAAARWGNRAVQAIHKGNFKEEFGIDVECYVLDNPQKTAVISQSGIGRALGLAEGGTALPRFLATKSMANFVGAELRAKLTQPLKFQWGSGGAEQPPATINGFDVAVLIDICQAIIQAEKHTTPTKRIARVAAQAHIIQGASAKAGITNLVYALAGYNPSATEVIAAFKAYVQEEARKYEKEFPNELYMQWHRLYEIPIPVRGKPWDLKSLTVKHIYFPLARSNGKIYQLVKAMKTNAGDRSKKLFQFLNEVGARALRMQLGRVLEMAESSSSKAEYEKKIVERFGGQQELDLVLPPSSE